MSQSAAAPRLAQPCSLEPTMNIDPALLSAMSALVGALIGGGASLTAAVYTQRHQDRLQRVARETTKREQVYADFIMDASKLLLNAYVHEELTLSVDEQHLVGLANRMRLFAPPTVIHEAEAVIKGLIEILLKPSISTSKTCDRGVIQELQFRSASTIQPGLPSGLGSGVPNRALNSANLFDGAPRRGCMNPNKHRTKLHTGSRMPILLNRAVD